MPRAQIIGLTSLAPTSDREDPPVPPRGQLTDAGGRSSALDDAVSVEISDDASPPSEVLTAIAGAAAAYDALAAAGLHVSIESDPESGRLNLSLQDPDGKVLSQLKPSQVLELADGNAPDQTRKSPDVNQQRQLDQ